MQNMNLDYLQLSSFCEVEISFNALLKRQFYVGFCLNWGGGSRKSNSTLSTIKHFARKIDDRTLKDKYMLKLEACMATSSNKMQSLDVISAKCFYNGQIHPLI